MLIRLHIRNLAVLDEIELELDTGFSALTGETGAGKSMLVDALALALGTRADSTTVRAGEDRAEVTAIFSLTPGSAAADWLAAHDLDAEGECQVRRVITAEGRSRGYVNGQPQPMETLRELGSQLVEICGQHAHQSLVQRASQRELLDSHGAHEALLATVAETHCAWTAFEREHQELLARQLERQDRQDLLRYQLQELQALNLQEGEFEALEQQRLLLTNVGRIAAGLASALERLYDGEESSVHDGIGSAQKEIQALAMLDPALAPAVDALEQARIQVTDAVELMRQRLGSLEHDPARQDEIEGRLDSALQLARKHRVEPERLWSLAGVMDAELASIDSSNSRLEQVGADCARALTELREAAGKLSAARSKAARALATAVTRNLRALGMPGATFTVNVSPLGGREPGPSGADDIEFLVSTNAGQPPGPIARVASGGELSRLSLAIQVVAMTRHGAPTLIFDEVDAGIGGGVAEIVGQCLRQLSDGRQVLCVTHLPQVASQADHHFAVSKTTSGRTTRTTVAELRTTERVDEIARMLGGVKITERTRAHAREMLQDAQQRRAG